MSGLEILATGVVLGAVLITVCWAIAYPIVQALRHGSPLVVDYPETEHNDPLCRIQPVPTEAELEAAQARETL